MTDFVSTGTKCNTCKIIFETTEEVKEHYRTDWHVQNSRRRGNNLPPITFEEFRKMMKKLGKAKPEKPKAVIEPRVHAPLPDHVKTILKADISTKTPSSSSSSSSSNSSSSAAATQVVNAEDEDEDEEEEEEDPVQEWIELPVGPKISIFDNKTFDSSEECLKHMSDTFGFFIPDRENLQDLDGLLEYLGEKVKRGGLCLCCQKQFTPGWSCINHMIDKSHCKISYEEDDDFDELEDFYDFESTFEDVNSDEEEEDDDETVGGVRRTLKVSHIGELVLVDGRLAGHRDLRRYYKQYFAPVEDRPCVLAVRRENLLKLGYERLGSDVSASNLSDVQIMRMIEVQHRELKKSRMMEDRGKQKHAFHTKRVQEYKSTVDALRSKSTRNAIIRDYHARLM